MVSQPTMDMVTLQLKVYNSLSVKVTVNATVRNIRKMY